jgi:hypothetical protein
MSVKGASEPSQSVAENLSPLPRHSAQLRFQRPVDACEHPNGQSLPFPYLDVLSITAV